jgi:hypothetical protein
MKVEAFQFLSRASPRQRPDTLHDLSFSMIERPFSLTFGQRVPRAPSIGAAQYVDEDEDRYLSRRCPTCIRATGTIHLPDGTDTADAELQRHRLLFLD